MRTITVGNTFLLFSLFLTSNANATLVLSDWKNSADQLITTDTISGLQWLNFSQTTAGHQTVRDNLHGTYDGFRFATSEELLGLFLSYVPGLDPGGYMFGTDAQISADLQTVMDELGYDDDQFTFVNTCAHAQGCDPLGFGAGDGIGRHILRADPTTSSYAVWFDDDNDFTNVQALVRIPEPSTLDLFIAGFLSLVISPFASRHRAKRLLVRHETRKPRALPFVRRLLQHP